MLPLSRAPAGQNCAKPHEVRDAGASDPRPVCPGKEKTCLTQVRRATTRPEAISRAVTVKETPRGKGRGRESPVSRR